jgi:hypothetical protein
MNDLARETERAIEEGRALVRDNREGGRHRRALSPSIGKGAAELKAKHIATKVARIAAAAVAIIVGAGIVGGIIGGIGFWGVMICAVTIAAAVFTLGAFPRLKVPRMVDLNTGDVRHLVGRTELWLEAQRPALPPPAVQLVDKIGGQLDALGAQLANVDQQHPATTEVRKLVGEYLPEMVDSYRKIPAHLRTEQRAGSTPDRQLVEGLGKISGEIDSVTRQLASGALDDLAIRTRYLDYKYGGDEVDKGSA